MIPCLTTFNISVLFAKISVFKYLKSLKKKFAIQLPIWLFLNLKFKFDCEEQWNIVEVPPNLMLAIKETTRQRRNNILLYSVLVLLSLFYQHYQLWDG